MISSASDLSVFREPAADCAHCPRLVAYRKKTRERYPDKHNAPVPAFGGLDAGLLVVGLAPGLKGANFSGRPFTGDYAGDLLYSTLVNFGFAQGEYKARPDDGLVLVNCRVTNAVRCVPPENKPNLAEKNKCRPFLKAEIAAMENLKVMIALGTVAHNAVLKSFGQTLSRFKFAHGAAHCLEGNGREYVLLDSYHCSRYNTQTGRLTEDKFHEVFVHAGKLVSAG